MVKHDRAWVVHIYVYCANRQVAFVWILLSIDIKRAKYLSEKCHHPSQCDIIAHLVYVCYCL